MDGPNTSAFVLTGVVQELGGVRILDAIDLAIPKQTFTAIIGPSGSGKTSLLRLLNRLDDPTSGTIRYRDRPIAELPVREHRARVGFVFQTPVLFSGSVRDNLAVAGAIAGIPPSDGDHRMIEVLELAEVDSHLLDRDSTRLSVGQKQRVSIARTLMTRPETLLLDEPTASLDPETADKLMNTVARLSRDRNVTVVAVTHRLAEAKKLSEYAAMLEGGKIVGAGPTGQMFENSEHPRIRSFLESMP